MYDALGAGVQRAIQEGSARKARMDGELLRGEFSRWERLFIKFNGPLTVVSTGVPTPNRDLHGHVIQNLADPPTPVQPLFVGIQRTETGGCVVMLWRPEDDKIASFISTLERLDPTEIGSKTVQFVFAHIENTYFACRWWESLSTGLQKYVAALARMGNPYCDSWEYRPGALVPWQITAVERSGPG